MTSTRRADAGGELGGADRLRLGHEALPALLLHRLGDVVGQGVGAGAGDVLVAEAADAVERAASSQSSRCSNSASVSPG